MSLTKRVRSYLAYREATHNLKHAFPDAQLTGAARAAVGGGAEGQQVPPEQCAICMERMAAAKQLPCGHMFHLPCLRAWLQQSGTESFACPLCRTPLMRPTTDGGTHLQAGGGSTTRWGRLAAFSIEAIGNVASRLYLDIAFALLMGLPLNPAALQHHHHHHHHPNVRQVQTAGGGGGRGPRHGGSSGGMVGGRRSSRRTGPLVEEVQESDTPAPSAANVVVRSSRPGSWLRGLFSEGATGSPAATLGRRSAPTAEGLGEEEGVDDGWTLDEEDSYSDDIMGTGTCYD